MAYNCNPDAWSRLVPGTGFGRVNPIVRLQPLGAAATPRDADRRAPLKIPTPSGSLNDERPSVEDSFSTPAKRANSSSKLSFASPQPGLSTTPRTHHARSSRSGRLATPGTAASARTRTRRLEDDEQGDSLEGYMRGNRAPALLAPLRGLLLEAVPGEGPIPPYMPAYPWSVEDQLRMEVPMASGRRLRMLAGREPGIHSNQHEMDARRQEVTGADDDSSRQEPSISLQQDSHI